MRNRFKIFFSDKRFAVFAILVGIVAGLFFLNFYLSKAWSYLSDDPKTCVNCHIMRAEYASWSHSSHRGRATCVDCHIPHNNIVRYYFSKSMDGARHVAMFVFRLDRETIRLNETGKVAVQENCLRCHENLTSRVSITNVTGENYKKGEGHLCWDCHRYVPHGRRYNRSSAIFALDP